MSKTSEMINAIKKMKVTSKDFFEIYKTVSDKYWTFDGPDEYQKCGSLMVKFAERADEQEVILAVRIIEQVMSLKKDNKSSAVITLGFTDGVDYTVEIHKDGIAKESFGILMADIAKTMKDGKVNFKDSRNEQ